MDYERCARRAFFCVTALLFAASAALTVIWSASMSTLEEMAMPGGWTLSMAWMRMPDQTWLGSMCSFLGMWLAMMVAMMLPALVPMLRSYRQAVRATDAAVGAARAWRLDWRTALVGAGYFWVWTLIGAAVFPLGAALAQLAMRLPALSRAVPIAVSLVVLSAGALQFTRWKSRHLACCRKAAASGLEVSADAGTAWRHGVRLGLHCSRCCAGLTAILLVVGVMDLRAMAVVTAANVIERFAPAAERAARVLGAVAVGAGVVLVVRAAGPG